MSLFTEVRSRLVGHDRSLVLERIADVAVDIGWVVRIIHILVPTLAVPVERYLRGQQHIADTRRRARRDGERIGSGISHSAIAIVTRIVVVQQIIVSGLAVWIDLGRQALEVADHGPHPWLAAIGAHAVGAAGIAVLRVPVVGPGLRVRILDLIVRRCRGVAVAVSCTISRPQTPQRCCPALCRPSPAGDSCR